MMKRTVLAVAGLIATAALSATAAAQTIVLRLGNDVAPASIQAKACDRFAEIVNKRNIGIEVKVFHANQLGNGVQQIQNVKLGVQEMVNTGYELLEPFSNDLRIAGTPFAFADREHFEAWLRSSRFETIQEEIVRNGNQRIVNLGVIWRRGPYRVMIANRPIMNLDDFSKVKYRVPESELQKRYWGKDGLGSTPVVLPLSDVYLSLRQGVVDAISMPLDLVVPMKFAEVGKFVMNTYDYPQFVGVMINETVWRRLTPEQRKALTEALDEAGNFYNAEIAANVENWKTQIGAMGAKIVDVDRKPFIERVRELNAKWEKDGYWRAGLLQEIEAFRKQ
jgi:TRAP-type C4-dicarboxylate transport system substrate-binding protein